MNREAELRGVIAQVESALDAAADDIRVKLAIAKQLAHAIEVATPPPARPGYLNVDQAAEYLACGKRRIYDLVQLGKLTPYRDGNRLLFDRDMLDKYVEGRPE